MALWAEIQLLHAAMSSMQQFLSSFIEKQNVVVTPVQEVFLSAGSSVDIPFIAPQVGIAAFEREVSSEQCATAAPASHPEHPPFISFVAPHSESDLSQTAAQPIGPPDRTIVDPPGYQAGGTGASAPPIVMDADDTTLLEEADGSFEADDVKHFAECLLRIIYKHKAPDKLSQIPEFLEKYSGRYPTLVNKVARKYFVSLGETFARSKHAHLFSPDT